MPRLRVVLVLLVEGPAGEASWEGRWERAPEGSQERFSTLLKGQRPTPGPREGLRDLSL